MEKLENLNSKWYWRLIKLVYAFILLLSLLFIIIFFWNEGASFLTKKAVEEREETIDMTYQKIKNKEINCWGEFEKEYNKYNWYYRNEESFFNPMQRIFKDWSLIQAYASTAYCWIDVHGIFSNETERDYFYSIKFTILGILLLFIFHLIIRSITYYIMLWKINPNKLN